MVYGSARNGVSLYNRRTGQTTHVGPDTSARCRRRCDEPQRAHDADRLVAGRHRRAVLRVERRVEDASTTAQLDAHQSRSHAPDVGGARQRRQVREHRDAGAAGQHHGALAVAARRQRALGRHRRRQHPGDDGRRREVDERHAAADQAVDAHLQHRRRPLRHARPPTPRRTRCASTTSIRTSGARTTAARRGRRSTPASRRARSPNSIREDPRRKGLLYAGDRHAGVGVVRRRRSLAVAAARHAGDLGARPPGEGRRDVPLLRSRSPARTAAASGFSTTSRRCGRRPTATAAPRRASAYLFKPATAVRVRFGTNDPTPWPPELPAGENPPPGAIIDYYLATDASGPITLEILDAAGKVVRTYSSTDPVFASRIRRGSGRVRQGLPGDADGRRLRPAALLAGAAVIVVDHAPACIVSAGTCTTIRLACRLWPPATRQRPARCPAARIRTQRAVGAAGPVHRAADGRRQEPDAADHGAARSARQDPPDRAHDAEHAQHRSLLGGRGRAPRVQRGAGADRIARLAIGRRRRQERSRGARADRTPAQPSRASPARRTPATPSLEAVSNALQAAAMSMQSAEVAPTAAQVAAAASARRQAQRVMARWATVKAKAAALR